MGIVKLPSAYTSVGGTTTRLSHTPNRDDLQNPEADFTIFWNKIEIQKTNDYYLFAAAISISNTAIRS